MKKITLSSSKINAVHDTLKSMHENFAVEQVSGRYDPKPVIDCIEKGLFHQAAEWAICSYLEQNGDTVDVDNYIADLIDDFEFIVNS